MKGRRNKAEIRKVDERKRISTRYKKAEKEEGEGEGRKTRRGKKRGCLGSKRKRGSKERRGGIKGGSKKKREKGKSRKTEVRKWR